MKRSSSSSKHRWAADFWTRLPEYQAAHSLGVAPVAGVYRAFPYPATFYLVARLGNSAYHAPGLWLKLGGALFSTLALLTSRLSCTKTHAGASRRSRRGCSLPAIVLGELLTFWEMAPRFYERYVFL